MDSMQSVRWKVYRAKQHFDELMKCLLEFYEKGPAEIGSLREENLDTVVFESKGQLPARIPLIFGDAIQNLRSSLDYLVWELVLAEGGSPDQSNAFPTAVTEAQFDDDIRKRKRLKGVGQEACDIIRSLQPFLDKKPDEHPLAVLDKLTNVNKHRRVLIVTVTGTTNRPQALLHLETRLNAFSDKGVILGQAPFWIYVAVDDGPVKGMEISALLDLLAFTVSHDVLERFGIVLELIKTRSRDH